jgi:hypothetical protein
MENTMWETLEEFVEWYKKEGFPIRPPFEDPVYVTDISYSYVLFRQGQYQAELYLVRPNTSSPDHNHPGVENIVMIWGGDIHTRQNGKHLDLTKEYQTASETGTNRLFGVCGEKLDDRGTHALIVGDKGGAFLSLEKWPEGVKPNSVTINWSGDPVDPGHLKIIQPLEKTYEME